MREVRVASAGALIFCPVSMPSATHKWYVKRGHRLERIPEASGVFLRLPEQTTRVTYMCTVANALGQADASVPVAFGGEAEVKVTPPDLAVPRGALAVLNCTAVPSGRVRWFRNAAPVEEDGRTRMYQGTILVVEDVRHGDEGVYRCQVEGEGGEVAYA
ncbi:unnamed protein product, partial [Darwinula stevensoni]